MRLLLDACVSLTALDHLAGAGHDVEWVGNWAQDPGDTEILRRAVAEDRVLVTLDRDFGELAIVHGAPHRGIVRLVGFASREQGEACSRSLRQYAEDLARGAIVTVERARVRVRPAE